MVTNNLTLPGTSKTVFGTYEWAKFTENFMDGCQHDCKYCYSKEMAIRFRRKSPNTWKKEAIRPKAIDRKFKRLDGRIMFPSSHDITPDGLSIALKLLQRMLSAGNSVLIVTKPHLECIDMICRTFTEYKSQLLFRFSIGSRHTTTLRFWEPGAPTFEERLESLKLAFRQGYQTSVSCEPMLDNDIPALVKEIKPYIKDSIWIGKANFLLRRLKMNGVTDKSSISKANELLDYQSDTNITVLYNELRDTSKIKWKESIKKVVGLAIQTELGLDI